MTEQRKRQVKALIARYKAEGRCVTCSQPSAPMLRCFRCRMRGAATAKRYRQRKQEAA